MILTGAELSADRDEVDQYIKVGFSRRQAFTLIGSWASLNGLINGGFTRRQAKALQVGTSIGDYIRQGGFTREQAEVLARHNLV